ncbi:hypothetical protein SLS60_003018 [Paraconiothyrium brasiliense]|uniref:F-box domain-containing protein n=1 Tax=Paraconiothyrium brasiliense TaxID=300254 RepID=A0ABR3RUH2_9PLEO
MNKLPQELVDHISSYLELEDLSSTLTVSPEFQVAAEKYSGVFDEFELSQQNGYKFADTYGGRRFGYLQHLSFRTTLPPLEEEIDWDAEPEGHPPRDTEEHLRAADESFSKQIGFLFSSIRNVEDFANTRYGPGKIKLTIYTPTRYVDRANYAIQRAYVSWRVRLLRPDTLPNLASVRALRIENGMSWHSGNDWDTQTLRKIDLRVLIDVSSKLSNLATVCCGVGGDEWLTCNEDYSQHYITKDWAGPRRDTRQDFGRTLAHTALPCVRTARLNFIAPLGLAHHFDQLEQFPNLVAPALNDMFSSSLHVLSQQLRHFSLTALIDHTLFWPSDGGKAPSWPNLETLNVTFHIMTPSGNWYFDCLKKQGSKQGYLIQDSDYPPYVETELDRANTYHADQIDWTKIRDGRENRVVPNEDTIIPLLRSFAKAASSMPRLKHALLWAPLELAFDGKLKVKDLTNHIQDDGCSPLAWGLYYASPDAAAAVRDPWARSLYEASQDEKAGFDRRNRTTKGTRHIWWHVAKWRPGKALHEVFTQIGKDIHGDSLLEHWEDEYNGSGYCHRDEFERVENFLFGREIEFPPAEPL